MNITHAKYWRISVILGVCLLLPIAMRAAETPMTLVRDGQPRAQVVLADRPTQAAQWAAAELQYHVRKITGVTLPIVSEGAAGQGPRILVGDSALLRAAGVRVADFRPQEYLIRIQSDTLILAGKDALDTRGIDYASGAGIPDPYADQATCYAVYDFLERHCGVRWYAPTEAGMVYPTQSTLTVSGVEVCRMPAFRYRVGQGEADYQRRVYLTPYRELWFDPPYEGREMRVWRCRLRMGGEAYTIGHSFYGYHALRAQHPEWFAQGYTLPAKMCYANEAFFQQVVADARESLSTGKPNRLNSRQHGNTYVSLVPEDGGGKGGGFCQCSRCKALLELTPNPAEVPFLEPVDVYSASNYVYDFVNRVARELRQSHPHAYVTTLAYQNYSFPPAREPLEPNVAVMLCLRTRNYWVPFTAKREQALYDAWVQEARQSKRPLYVWLYYTFPREIMGERMFPGFFARTAARQIKMFARDGIAGAFLNGLGEQIDTYVTFKLLDDPTQDVETLLHEFFTRYYGQAGAPLEQLYREMEEIYSDPQSYPESIQTANSRYTHQSEEIAWKYLGTAERMKRWQSLMDAARMHTHAGSELERQRVAAFEAGIWRPMVTAASNYQLRAANEPLREVLKRKGAPRLRVPRVPAASGDAGAIDWTTAAAVVNRAADAVSAWPTVDGYPSDRAVHAQIAHDGEYLYVRLSEDQIETTGLMASSRIESDDTWEMYVADTRGRAQPFRRLWINSRGDILTKRFFEEAGDEWDITIPLTSDITANRWTVLLALPLHKLLPAGAPLGKPFYINFVRASDAKLPNGQLATLTWSPTFHQNPYYIPRQVHLMPWKVWDTGALGEVVLEK
jgi:hypothetical protein